MDRCHIPTFPNPISRIDWLTYLPIFRDKKEEDVSLHLIKFHMHVCSLGVEFHEDSLMNIFMETL